jgi:beta-lactamase class A
VKTGLFTRVIGALALAGGALASASTAHADSLENAFDQALGKEQRAPLPSGSVLPPTAQPFVAPPVPRVAGSGLEAMLASVAPADQGRIGVAAIDLATGRTVSVLGDQPFPMASTSKIAIVATFLDGVDRGKFRLTDMFPLMVPVPSGKYSTAVAPVRAGQLMSAQSLIELTITRSDNQATDALLAAVGGPAAVNRWLRQSGIPGMRLDRDIATLVRDDGEVNPATTIDARDSATPLAMTRLISGIYRGEWLSPASRRVLIGAMERCETGKRRIRGMLPEGTVVAHKTGTLSNTASDVGIIHTPDGRALVVAIYVTGQGGKRGRDDRIATIARTLYDGYLSEGSSLRRTAFK